MVVSEPFSIRMVGPPASWAVATINGCFCYGLCRRAFQFLCESELVNSVILTGFGSETELSDPFPFEQNFLMNDRFYVMNVSFFGMKYFYVNRKTEN